MNKFLASSSQMILGAISLTPDVHLSNRPLPKSFTRVDGSELALRLAEGEADVASFKNSEYCSHSFAPLICNGSFQEDNCMYEDNKALVRRWFEEVWNQQRVEAIDEMFATDGIAHGLSDDPEQPVRGPADFRVFHAKFCEAFPNMSIAVDDVIAEDDKVVARCSVRGKHLGHSLGIAATQAPVEFGGITILRIRNGQIVEAWNQFDFMKMYKQLGAI